MKFLPFALGAVGLVAFSRASAESSAEGVNFNPNAVVDNPVVARGKGFEITRREMDQVLATARANNPADELPPDAGFHVLTHLIEIRLVMQKATEQEKAEGKQKNDENFIKIMKTLGEPEFTRRLKATQMTPDELRLMLFQEATAQTSLTRQLGIKVMDADAKKYFDANPGAFDQPAKARVRELLLLTTVGYSSNPLPEATIQAKHRQIFELRKRVRDGEDFATLVKQYNEDFISKSDGEVVFRQDQMAYGDLAFSMKPNQISEVVTTDDGYVFFQLLEKIPAKKVTYDDVADRLKRMLVGQQKRMLAPAYIRQLRKDAAVEILDPKLKADEAANEAAAAEADRTIAALNAAKTKDTNTPPAQP